MSIEQFQNKYKFTLIHSRKPVRSCSLSPWIQMTQRILDDHDIGSELFVTSAGMLHFDVPLVYWLIKGGTARVILHKPLSRWSMQKQKNYRWLKNNRKIQLIELSGNSKEILLMQERDRQIVCQIDGLETGQLNPDGRMKKLIRDISRSAVHKTYRRMTVSEKNSNAVFKIPGYSRIKTPVGFQNYIWHLTRSRFEPWPDETQYEYVTDLLGLRHSAPYNAEIVLKRILERKKIVPGGYLIRGGYPVISFTDAPWETVQTFFKWQAHLRRIRFEPYAIGIEKNAAKTLGFKPVLYCQRDEFDDLPESQKWLFQNKGSGKSVWIDEAEWRFCGEVCLNSIPQSAMRVLTPLGVQFPDQYINGSRES